jgi:hypothetical protein
MSMIVARAGLDFHSLRGVAARIATADDLPMTDAATHIDQYNAAFLERAPEKLVDLIAPDGRELRMRSGRGRSSRRWARQAA